MYSKDTTSGIETEFLKAIKGTPSVESPAIPSHIDGNSRAGDIYSEFPLYKVTLDGINIVSIDPLYEVLTSMAELKTMTDELNRKLPKNIPLSENENGVLILESARIKIIYGAYPLNSFTNHQESGGYAKEIDISKYGLKDPVWGTVSTRYPNGHPHAFIGVINANKLILLSDANVSGGYAQWMVVGNYF